MTTYIVLKILSDLILPPASLAVGVLLCLVLLLFRLKRLALVVLGLALAQTLIMAFPPVGDALIGGLETRAREAAAASPRCCFDAILILGGAMGPAMPPTIQEPALTESSDRVWLGAHLYHAGIAPRIIVSGGSFLEQQGLPATTEAEAMRRFLLDLGVPANAIVDEGRSLNTIENMRNVHAMVGDARVALVTSAFHMPRALRIAAREGLNVSAFPSDFRAVPEGRPFWENWLPTIEGIANSNIAARELLALAFDWRIPAATP
jgi:uncharacterized SAM-binding protein YcdF (DUF218 family)